MISKIPKFAINERVIAVSDNVSNFQLCNGENMLLFDKIMSPLY